MKALVLAAGGGGQLKELTRYTNKCCLRVGNTSIIRRLVDHLHKSTITHVAVVVGHCADRVREEAGPHVSYVQNPLFHSAGILLSLWLARHSLSEDKLLITTGDNFFHESVLSGLLATPGEIVVAVKRKSCVASDVKVVVEGDRITQFERDIPAARAVGSFGMFVLFNNPALVQTFFEITERFLTNEQQHARLIDVLNNMISQGYVITPYYFPEHLSVGIDTYEDLEQARRLHELFLTGDVTNLSVLSDSKLY